jgi:hypothetical protein
MRMALTILLLYPIHRVQSVNSYKWRATLWWHCWMCQAYGCFTVVTNHADICCSQLEFTVEFQFCLHLPWFVGNFSYMFVIQVAGTDIYRRKSIWNPQWRNAVWSTCKNAYPNIKVKQSHYRPGQVLKLPEGWGSQISRELVHEGGKVNPSHRPPLPPGDIPGTYFW